jgi:hypothetical protein
LVLDPPEFLIYLFSSENTSMCGVLHTPLVQEVKKRTIYLRNIADGSGNVGTAPEGVRDV